jgi:hypothetical protein
MLNKIFLFIFFSCFFFTTGLCKVTYSKVINSKDTIEPTEKLADTTAGGSNKIRYIDVIAEYGSNYTYRHQTDATSTVSPYLYPSLFYHAKSGFWVSAGAYRFLNSYHDVNLKTGDDTILAAKFIEGDLALGWDFKAGKKTDLSFSYTLSKFDRNITFLKEALGNTFEAYGGHDFKFIYSGLRIDYSFQDFTGTINNAKKNFSVHDYYAMWENSHEWYFDDVFKNGDEFDLNPIFTIIAGTNNFVGKYLTLRYPDLNKPSGKKAAQYSAIARSFLIQQFSLNIPVAYTIGNLTFTPSLEYTLLTQKKTETQPTSYPIYRFSVAYRFNFKK